MLRSPAPIVWWVLHAAVVVWCIDCHSLISARSSTEWKEGALNCQRPITQPHDQPAEPTWSFSLLQASSLRSKEAVAGLPGMREHPDDMSPGGEALIRALGNWWHPRLPWMGANNGTADQNGTDVHVHVPEVHRRPTGHWKISPPLTQLAQAADHDFIHDEQPVKKEPVAAQRPKNSLMKIGAVNRSMHLAVALMLLGAVVFVLAIFYMIEFPHPDAQQAFLRLLSTAVSTFVAVLIFSTTQELIAYFFEHGREHHGVEVGHRGLVNRRGRLDGTIMLLVCFRFFLFWLLLQYFLIKTSREFLLSAAAGRIGVHLMAFAAVDFFGTLQGTPYFSQSLLHISAAFLILSLFFWGWFILADWFRSCCHAEDSEDIDMEEHDRKEEWRSTSRSADEEAASLVLGLLLSQCIRFATAGHFAPPYGGYPMGMPTENADILLFIGALLGFLLVPAEMLVYELDPDLSSRRNLPLINVLRGTCSMTMAWCLLYWSKWSFWLSSADNEWGYGDKMSAFLAIAITLSVVCFASIFTIEWLADTYAREQRAALVSLNAALGLVMGLAWETTFHAAVTGVGDLPYLSRSYLVNNIGLTLALCAVILPAWIFLVFPRAMQQWQSGSKSASQN